MPFDATPLPRILTDNDAKDLAVLKKARDLIRWRLRWSKHPVVYGYCAVTALNAAAKSVGSYRHDPYKKLESQLPPRYRQSPFRYHDRIIAYNDARATKHVDILKLFDSAIAELEVSYDA